MKVQLYVVDTHGWDYVTNYIDTKTMKENLFLAKMTLKMQFLLLDTFFIEAYFCIIYTGCNTTWPKAIHFHALYRVSVSINQWIRRLLLLWIIHMWIWENSLKANSFPFSESSCVPVPQLIGFLIKNQSFFSPLMHSSNRMRKKKKKEINNKNFWARFFLVKCLMNC